MNRYLFDTCIWSALLKRIHARVGQRFAKLKPDQVMLSPVALGELWVGFLKGDQYPSRTLAIEQIVANSNASTVELGVTSTYAQVRTTLEQLGTPIDRNDTWIAAEALYHGYVLVTNNTHEFDRVPGLRVENWLA